jgi:hypothetical protein
MLSQLGQNLKSLYESLGPRQCVGKLSKLLKSGEIRPDDFSLRELAEAFCGEKWVHKLNEANVSSRGGFDVMEAGDAVDVSAFSNITGQIVYSKIHQGWNEVDAIGDELFETVKTNFDGEKIPGIGKISKDGYKVLPGQPYPELGFGEHYWQTPSTVKTGMIVSVTKEAIFFDRTSLILKRASEVGERLRYHKEKRQLAVYAGITITEDDGTSFAGGSSHVWNGNTYNTYSTSTQTNGVDNIYPNAVSGNVLADWTDIEAVWLLYQNQLAPDTGLPLTIRPDTLVVMPNYFFTAKRIASATEIRSGDITTSPGTQTLSGNPLNGFLAKVLQSQLLYQLVVGSGVSAANAAKWFFYGQPKKAFWYMENWPLTVVQAPAQNTAEFERDVVARYKASERGVPWCADPRFNAKSYDS